MKIGWLNFNAWFGVFDVSTCIRKFSIKILPNTKAKISHPLKTQIINFAISVKIIVKFWYFINTILGKKSMWKISHLVFSSGIITNNLLMKSIFLGNHYTNQSRVIFIWGWLQSAHLYYEMFFSVCHCNTFSFRRNMMLEVYWEPFGRIQLATSL